MTASRSLAMWDAYKRAIVHDIRSLPGWCSPEKAELMMDLVVERRMRTCVDVGTFGGSSCLPVAEALRYRGEGEVYAVDAWRLDVAVEGWALDTVDYRWWSALDFERLHGDFCELVRRRGLADRCRVMRMRASEAAGRFADASIDLVHLDGNHHEDQAVADVMAFLPKVRNGGLLLINDANWPCMRKALVLLLERTRVLSPYGPSSAWMLLARDLAREQRAASLTTT